MADYKFVLYKIIGNTPAGELRCSDVEFSYALSGYGSFSFTVAMADDAAGDPFLLTTPKRFVWCVERDGALVYAGIVWSRTLDYNQRTITVQGNEWGSIYARQIVLDYGYDSKQVKLVLDDLLNAAGNLPLPAGGPRQGTGGGLDNPVTGYFAESSHLKIYATISQLAASATDGFEFRWSVDYSATGALQYRCVVGSPLGTTQPRLLDWYAPGGGATFHTLTQDEADNPSNVYVYSSDGFRIARFLDGNPITADSPVATFDAWTYPVDMTDQQISDIASSRYDNLRVPISTTFDLSPGIVSPTSLTAYGVEGDNVPVTIQQTEASAPALAAFRALRLVGRGVRIDNDGQDTLTLSLAYTN